MILYPSRRFAWIVAGSGLFLALAALAVGYVLDSYGSHGNIVIWYQPLIEIMPILGALFVGGLIAAHIPHNIYGWIWLLLGWGAGVLQHWGSLLAVSSLSAMPPRFVLGGIAMQLAGIGWLTAISMIPLAILLFPTGHLPSSRWRWVSTTMLTAMGFIVLTFWAIPGPSGSAPVDNPFGQIGYFGQVAEIVSTAAIAYILFLMIPLAVLSLIFRYRKADNLEQAQLRWLLFIAAANVIFLVLDSTDIHQPLVSEEIMTILNNLFLTGLPIAVAVAILRYRLFDIDFLIRRTLQYTLLTGLLVLVYFGSVVLLQNIVENLTGEQSPIVIVISTLGIAALFNPLRTRVQDFIDRRFFRKKFDAEQTLASFAAIARDEVDMDKLTTELLSVVEETIQPEKVSLWLRKDI